MNRRSRITIWLLSGTLFSVVLAWAILPIAPPISHVQIDEYVEWGDGVILEIGDARSIATRSIVFGWQKIGWLHAPQPSNMALPVTLPLWAHHVRPSSRLEDAFEEVVIIQAHGWPSPACLSTTRVLGSTMVSTDGIVLNHTTADWRGLKIPVVLGYKPIWHGIVLNAMFWSLIAISGGELGVLVQRWYRLHHSLCISCGYDLRHRGENYCPECGSRFQ